MVLKQNVTRFVNICPQMDIIESGKILIHGTHTLNNITYREGTHLILCNETNSIDGQNYTNDDDVILKGCLDS